MSDETLLQVSKIAADRTFECSGRSYLTEIIGGEWISLGSLHRNI